MSPGRVSEIKRDKPFTHRLSPESSDKVWLMAAGLLAFHIAGAFPFPVTETVAYSMASNKKWITVAGTAPE